MMTSMSRRSMLILALLLASAVPLVAALTGDIRVQVLDAQGLPVSGATITLTNDAIGVSRVETTGSDGTFSFLQLDLGTYQILVQKAGFRSYVLNDVAVRDGRISEAHVALQVGALADTVTVAAGPESVFDAATAQVSTAWDSSTILGLPLANLNAPGGRDPVTFADLTPGVEPTSADNTYLLSGNFNANGQTARSNNLTIDSVMASDTITAEQGGMGTFSLDSVQEITVITSGFAAEFGRNSGAQVVIVTKSGGNQFHGTAYGFFENAALNAKQFFASSKPPFSEEVWGGNLGGPIVKNRFFFFADYQGMHSAGQTTTVDAAALTPAQVAGITDPTSLALFNAVDAPESPTGIISTTAPNNIKQFEWSVRLDENLNGGKDLFTERYGTNPVTAVTPSLVFFTSTLPNYGAEESAVNHFVNASYTHIFNPSIVNQARFEFVHDGFLFDPFTTLTAPYAPAIDIAGFPPMGVSTSLPQSRVQNVFQAGDTLSWSVGRNAFKFGTDVFHYQIHSVFDDFVRGEFLYGSLAGFQTGALPQITFAQGFGEAPQNLRETDVYLFAQDDIRLTRTLTLNLGLRFESSGGASDANNILANLNQSSFAPLGGGGSGPLGSIQLGGDAYQRNNNWAPRIGAAWNPGGGKLVLRAYYGWLYDFVFLNPIINEQSFTAPYFDALVYSGSQMTGANSYADFAAGTSAAQAAAAASIGRFPANEVNFGSIYPVQQNLKNPLTKQWNVGVEYQVSHDFILKATYIGSVSSNLLVSLPINLIPVQNRPAPATSLSDETARYSQFLTAYEYENGNASGSVVNDLLDHRFNSVIQVQSAGHGAYEALQIQAVKLMHNGLSFQGSYTYAHSWDDVSDALQVYGNDYYQPQNPQDLSSNWGPSAYDVRHRGVVSAMFQIPWSSRFSGFRRGVLHGWAIDAVFVAQSGLPVTIFSGPRLGIQDVALIGANQNAQVWANGDVRLFTPAPEGSAAAAAIPSLCERGVGSGCANTSDFPLTQPLLGNFGDSGRNQLRLYPFADLDTALVKNTPVKENWTIQFRWEMFNAFNRANFSGFVNTLTSPNFGTYTATANPPRSMQFALKLLF